MNCLPPLGYTWQLHNALCLLNGMKFLALPGCTVPLPLCLLSCHRDQRCISALCNLTLAVQVVGPLLHERDLYLAWSLKRSKAVNGRHHPENAADQCVILCGLPAEGQMHG